MNMSEQERLRAGQLLMAEMDNEISREERRELDSLLAQYPDLETERKQLQTVKEMTMNIKLKEPEGQVWDVYWRGVYNRIERGIGWILFSLGAMVLLVYGMIEFVNAVLADTGMVWWAKGALLLLLTGCIVLLVSVIRERFFHYKTERYKDVQQ
jgi:hypothetical protein